MTRAYKAAWMRQRRAERRLLGRCPECGETPKANYTLCDVCLKKIAERASK